MLSNLNQALHHVTDQIMFENIIGNTCAWYCYFYSFSSVVKRIANGAGGLGYDSKTG